MPNDSLDDLLDDTENKAEVSQFANVSPTNSGRRHSTVCQPQIELETPKPKERKPPNRLALALPPIPPRTFQGKILKGAERDIKSANATTTDILIREKGRAKNLSEADSKLDDLCSISFDDIGDSDDLVIFDKKSHLVDPNQSSSDSNRSQTTIDTGYISAFETDRSSITTNQRQFRSRFSSEDTQSSLDSYLSSDLQRADTIESLQSNFTDSPFILKKNSNIFNFEQIRLNKKISSSGSIDSDIRSITPIKTHTMRRLPAVPARKGIRQRGTPPVPPMRQGASQLLETGASNSLFLFFILR